MSATKLKELETENADLRFTVQSHGDELVSQLNTILALRREINMLRAALNGAKVDS